MYKDGKIRQNQKTFLLQELKNKFDPSIKLYLYGLVDTSGCSTKCNVKKEMEIGQYVSGTEEVWNHNHISYYASHKRIRQKQL